VKKGGGGTKRKGKNSKRSENRPLGRYQEIMTKKNLRRLSFRWVKDERKMKNTKDDVKGNTSSKAPKKEKLKRTKRNGGTCFTTRHEETEAAAPEIEVRLYLYGARDRWQNIKTKPGLSESARKNKGLNTARVILREET